MHTSRSILWQMTNRRIKISSFFQRCEGREIVASWRDAFLSSAKKVKNYSTCLFNNLQIATQIIHSIEALSRKVAWNKCKKTWIFTYDSHRTNSERATRPLDASHYTALWKTRNDVPLLQQTDSKSLSKNYLQKTWHLVTEKSYASNQTSTQTDNLMNASLASFPVLLQMTSGLPQTTGASNFQHLCRQKLHTNTETLQVSKFLIW